MLGSWQGRECVCRTVLQEPQRSLLPPSHGLLPPPLQVIFGIVGGLLAGIILGCTRWFNSRYKRLVGLYGAALLLMYFLEYYNLLSGGWPGAGMYGAGCGDVRGGEAAQPSARHHGSCVVPGAAWHCLTAWPPAPAPLLPAC
jgi:hypothetical protein